MTPIIVVEDTVEFRQTKLIDIFTVKVCTEIIKNEEICRPTRSRIGDIMSIRLLEF